MYRVLVRCLTYARPWRSVTNSLSETVPSELASLTQLQELCAAHARRGLARFGAARRRSARARSGDGGALAQCSRPKASVAGAARRRSARARSGDGGALAQHGRPKASVALGALRGCLAARLGSRASDRHLSHLRLAWVFTTTIYLPSQEPSRRSQPLPSIIKNIINSKL